MIKPASTLLLILSVGACAAPTPHPVEATARPLPAADAREAIARSLPFLERGGDDWMEGRVAMQEGKRCVSCHHVAYAIWGHEEARRSGIPIPEERLADLRQRAVEFLDEAGVRAMSTAPLLLALGEQRDAALASLADEVAGEQQSSGAWRARGQFPDQRRPIEESDAVATMWTLMALQENADAAARARAWLEGAGSGSSTEWLALRAMQERGERVSELVGAQNEDGGWGWLPGEPSNAYSTGQALYALATIGGGKSAGSRARAVAWLLAAQRADGSWSVPSASISTAGERHRDEIYTFWGSAWASIALSRSIARQPYRRADAR